MFLTTRLIFVAFIPVICNNQTVKGAYRLGGEWLNDYYYYYVSENIRNVVNNP